MEQLIELLKQIQELAGTAVDALEGAAKGGTEGEGAPHHGGDMPPEGEGAPPGPPR